MTTLATQKLNVINDKKTNSKIVLSIELSKNMWVIVEFVDDEVAGVPISWLTKSNGRIQCLWPKTDERQKRAKGEIPPSILMDDWELHDCVMLLNGAIYEDFEDALAIEMGCVDVNDVDTDRFPKLSWTDEEIEHTENTEIASVVAENIIFSDFQELLNRPDLCSTLNEDLGKGIENVLPNIQSEVLDTILKNQEEKKKMLVKLMTKMYSLESTVGCNTQLSD